MTTADELRVATAEAVATLDGQLVDGRDSFTIDHELVLDTARRLAQSGVIDEVTAWARQDAKGPGGAPEKFPKGALLTVMFVAARLGRRMLVVEGQRVIRCMTPATREAMGLPEPPSPSDGKAHLAYYRNLRTRFHAIERLMDFSPVVKNRRLAPDELARR